MWLRALTIFAMLGCGSSEPPVGTSLPARVRIDGWPTIPFQPASIALRALIELVEHVEPLAEPEEASRWAREVHGPWAERRAEHLARASEARRLLRAAPAHELAIGAGLHGDFLRQTALQLETVDLRVMAPEAAAMVRAPVVDLNARATAAYEVCASRLRGAELDGWRRECRRRANGPNSVARDVGRGSPP